MERQVRTRLATLGILLLVFGTGVLLGMALQGGVEESPAAEAGTAEARGEDANRRGRMIDRVDLSPEQRVKADSIVAAFRERMKALHEEFREGYNPRYWAIIDEARMTIKAELTPEQVELYDSLLAERDRERGRDLAGERFKRSRH